MKDIDWANLPFGYMDTNYNVRCYYRDGKWGEIETSSSNQITMHMGASCLHYGQELFEGLKAFKGKDGKTRVFRWDENLKRINESAKGVMMPEFAEDTFKSMLDKALELNKEFIPPYGSGASLYVRPLMIGTGAQIGVKPADEYMFIIFVMPVGPYFKEGFKPGRMMVTREFDRAAPLGTGRLKVGGNYAASLRCLDQAHELGFGSAIFLDAKEKKYIDEAGPANFFGIKDNTYITPKSESILPSITNKSLVVIAEDLGMKVERRPVALTELDSFEEAGCCGTAAVISPIGSIVDIDNKKDYIFSKNGEAGPVSKKLYETLTGIQSGEIEDTHNWVTTYDF